nr:DUF4276 family protein [Thermoanaerobaculia bacterium]
YVEGGGQSKALRAQCRRGFAQFLSRAGLAGRMPRVVACGARTDAFKSFALACTAARAEGDSILLVDAEGPVSAANPWDHLSTQDGWKRPSGAREGQCQLMVQCMESWFLADREALSRYFGQGFQTSSLPAGNEVEKVGKQEVLFGLDRAARPTAKGGYAKGEHSFRLLGLVDPELVARAAPSAARLLAELGAQPAPGTGP